jgi:hypothetical protein
MRAALLTILLFPPIQTLAAQMPPVGRVEVFGDDAVVDRVRASLADLAGRPVSADLEARARSAEKLAGVGEVGIDAVCCDGGTTTLYVAVRKAGVPAARFRPAPRDSVRLPAPIVSLGARLDSALADAARRGAVREDQSAGHSLMEDSTARVVQREFMTVAVSQDSLLRAVLAGASEAGHRALAGEILAYAPDKAAIVAPLLEAVRDPDPAVRNVASRALWIIAVYAAEHPKEGIAIPSAPFIDLLQSVEWTDRNKAAMVLMQLSTSRDSSLLTALRERAFDPLVDMARWANMGHAFPGVVMLGRIAGITEEAIFEALSRGEKEPVIEAALRSRAGRS